MKRFLAALAFTASTTLCLGQAPLDYVLFDAYPLPGGYLYLAVESTAPSWAANLGGKLPVRTEPAYTPGSALELTYVWRAGGTWSAKILRRPIRGQDEWDNGVFVQSKPTPFKTPEVLHLRIHAGKTPASALPTVALMLSSASFSVPVRLEPFVKKPDAAGWSLVSIPISEFRTPIKAAEQVSGIVLAPAAFDEAEHTIYLDDVDLRPAKDPSYPAGLKPALSSVKGFENHVDVAWTPVQDRAVKGTIVERSTDGVHFAPVGFRARGIDRYADYVGATYGTYHYRARFLGYDGTRSAVSAPKSARTRPMRDDELLGMVQEASARYYWEGAEPDSGMTLESIPGDPHMIAVGASGFGIMSLVVAADRGFFPRADVAKRMLKIIGFLEKADRFHGVWPHYLDGRTGRIRTFFGPDDNGGDLVETSFLAQGLLTARRFFDRPDPQETQIRERITALWEAIEWDWHRTADPDYLLWHWSPDKAWKIHHRLIGWNETMITYLLAIAAPKHGVPPSMYYSGWASQERQAQEYRGDGPGKMYSNGQRLFGKTLDVGGFVGGPIFFIHYNFMGMDPRGLRDKYADYFENSRTIAEINLRYCMENPQKHRGYGEDGWGLTASDGPWGYNPDEPRADGDKGKLTPTGAVASMPYLPGPAMAALKSYYRRHGSFLWGEYGFRDAFSLDEHWVNDLYMGLNQGPMVVMIENHRTGRPWKLFGANPEIREMRRKVFEASR
ncbi:MAG: hypothetical protein HY059_18700 [Proteobacteria bacterium]|nr:hypothetical protein [Pseudomonadota bacterium]